MQELFTIGHSTHPLEDFVGLLARHRISAVGDVRSQPYSRYNPQYNRENLKEALESREIVYVFLGREIGARSDNPANYVQGRVQYDLLAKDPLFISGLDRVRRGLAEYRLALMCAEKDATVCHRGILICRQLRTPDLEIKHILADGGVESQNKMEERLMNSLAVKPDMFMEKVGCVEEAYRRQAEKLAYTVQSDGLKP